MKNILCNFLILMMVLPIAITAQNDWLISASPSESQPYYGITAANGMIGLISSPNPFEVKEVVLAGAYDLYGRGRVSNFLKSFNLLNAQIAIDGSQIQKTNIQELNRLNRARVFTIRICLVSLTIWKRNNGGGM